MCQQKLIYTEAKLTAAQKEHDEVLVWQKQVDLELQEIKDDKISFGPIQMIWTLKSQSLAVMKGLAMNGKSCLWKPLTKRTNCQEMLMSNIRISKKFEPNCRASKKNLHYECPTGS